jgi:hypothetical protein
VCGSHGIKLKWKSNELVDSMDIFWEDNSFGFDSPLLQSPCILQILQQEISTKQSIYTGKRTPNRSTIIRE